MSWSGRKVLVTGAGRVHRQPSRGVRSRATGREVRAFVRYNSRNDYGWLEQLDETCATRSRSSPATSTNPEAVARPSRIARRSSTSAPDPDPVLVPAPARVRRGERGRDAERARGLSARTGAPRRAHVDQRGLRHGADVPIDEEHPLNAQSPYAATKIAADQLALSYRRSFETPVVVARPFNTYGPRQSARAVIPTLITQALALETRRARLHASDARLPLRRGPGARLHALRRGRRGRGRGDQPRHRDEISIAELAETVFRLVGRESALTYSDGARPAREERGRAAPRGREQGEAAARLGAGGLARRGPAADDRVVRGLARRLQAVDLQRLAR